MRAHFTVYTLNPLEDPRWPEFMESHAAASVFHTRHWLEALRHTYSYAPIVYTTAPPGEPLTNGIVLCRIHSWITGRRLVSLPFTDHCDVLVDKIEDRVELFTFLTHTVKHENYRYAEIRPLSTQTGNDLGYAEGESFCFHSLDLRPPLDTLFSNLHKDSIQRKIKRAEREGLEYRQGRSEDLLEQFYPLFVKTRKRNKVPPQPLKWFRSLLRFLGDRITFHVACCRGQVVAAIVTLWHRNTVIYKYGCSDSGYHNLGAVQFLWWQVICEAKASAKTTFDLGRSDIDDTGLIQFKRRWGAQEKVLTYQRVYLRPQTVSASTLGFAQHLFAHMPEGLLTATGNLLYKHVG